MARSRPDEAPLAETVTADGGHFRISEVAESAAEAERLALVVDVPDGKTEPAEQPVELAFGEPLTVSVQLPAVRVTPATWRTIGRRARDARIAHLHELVRELLRPAADSLFGDIDLSTRHAVTRRLEHAFLDPQSTLGEAGDRIGFAALRDGETRAALEKRFSDERTSKRVALAVGELLAKVATFDSILTADWMIDPDALERGDLTTTVDRFKDMHREGVELDLDVVPWLFPRSTPIGYRDYLRTIFTGPTSANDYGQHLLTLKDRFKQDFETQDDAARPANEVVAPIVREALVAPTGAGHGFGVDAPTIQPQGERTSRAYLDYLIGLSGLSATDLGHRIRLDLGRPDASVSSPVGENIFTLRRLYSDDFQVEAGAHPIIPANLVGLPPFYLQYEEWLEKIGPFYGENYYRPQDSFFIDITPQMREAVKVAAAGTGSDPNVTFLGTVLQVQEQLLLGNARLEQLEYGLARANYEEASRLASSALWISFGGKRGTSVSPATVISTLGPRLTKQLALPMDAPPHLDAYVKFFRFAIDGLESIWEIQQWITDHLDEVRHSLMHLYVLVLPTMLGDIALANGDYGGAIFQQEVTTAFILARAKTSDSEGWDHEPYPIPTVHDPEYNRDVYVDGGLPYTTPTKPQSWFPYWSPRGLYAASFATSLAAELIKAKKIHFMERHFFALRHAGAILEWADSLYRSDQPSSIQRARELYKAVLWLHGSAPPIGGEQTGVGWLPGFLHSAENPALVSQKKRALAGLAQIDAGLNYYGADDSVVPPLRYRPLKDAADRLATSAKAAQQDFLLAIGNVEDALKEELITANMLKKAEVQARIAGEQAKVAEVGVQLAQQQVKVVQAQIEAKRKEIEDHDSLSSQFKETFSGMADVIGGMPTGVTGGVKEGAMVGTGLSSASEGSIWASGVAAGGAVLGAYALFLYAGITSMQAMTDAQTSRENQLKALKNEALPLAEAQVTARQREVGIAKLQQQIAEADAQLAGALIHFQRNRFLNVQFWAELGSVMKRVMRRYLALGGRYGWLAERALAYEQDRSLDIIRFDYFPERLQGITGADLLAADLAELDAARLEAMRRTVPVQRTYSLAFDFPLQFGQLTQTGSCTFMTEELPLTTAYPGTYGYRIRAVTAAVLSYAGAAPSRGLLTNLGASFLSREDGARHVSLRAVDALPLSEFRLAKDMAVYGLPDETLMPFEGSGIETTWTLEFPAAANAGLAGVADVQITIDLQALYSPVLREVHIAALTGEIRRFIFLSGAYQDPKALEDLQGQPGNVSFDFDLAGKVLPGNEKNRKFANVVVLAGAVEQVSFNATLTAGSVTIPFGVDDGVAFSNAPPLTDALSTVTLSPLNVLAGKPLPQTVRVALKKSANPGLNFKTIQDIVLGIEYTAELT